MKNIEVLENLRQRILFDPDWTHAETRGAVIGGIQLSIEAIQENERREALAAVKPGVPELVPPIPVGIDIIGSMTRNQLIQEIIHNQTLQLADVDTNGLKQMVIQSRCHHYQHRLMKEARLEGLG